MRPLMVLLIGKAARHHAGFAYSVTEGQLRLAEITEMIHVASLAHDDVIDQAETRRGAPSLNSVHGNKISILAGDFLLGRASLALARLRNTEVRFLYQRVHTHTPFFFLIFVYMDVNIHHFPFCFFFNLHFSIISSLLPRIESYFFSFFSMLTPLVLPITTIISIIVPGH